MNIEAGPSNVPFLSMIDLVVSVGLWAFIRRYMFESAIVFVLLWKKWSSACGSSYLCLATRYLIL